jgi:hypothetical protein
MYVPAAIGGARSSVMRSSVVELIASARLAGLTDGAPCRTGHASNSGEMTAGASSISAAWLTTISGASAANACVIACAWASAESG